MRLVLAARFSGWTPLALYTLGYELWVPKGDSTSYRQKLALTDTPPSVHTSAEPCRLPGGKTCPPCPPAPRSTELSDGAGHYSGDTVFQDRDMDFPLLRRLLTRRSYTQPRGRAAAGRCAQAAPIRGQATLRWACRGSGNSTAGSGPAVSYGSGG